MNDLKKIYENNVIDSIEKFVDYYNKKIKSFQKENKIKKFYAITLKSRFRTTLRKIWSCLEQQKDLSIREYIDCVFDNARSLEDCLPHKFLSHRNITLFNNRIQKNGNPIFQQEHLHLLITLEINEFLESIQTFEDYKKIFEDKDKLEYSLKFLNFPPKSILSVSKYYFKWFFSLSSEERKRFVNPESISYLKMIILQHKDLIEKIKNILGEDLSL